ncbi:MAG: bacterial transcriptional activator domain-containing protein [Propionibacteriaceae bacterium]|jgi:hypothetical protein|nr:bacterial transcriptional activator domain-containing protein [Propionibacteriaceae bacterium]
MTIETTAPNTEPCLLSIGSTQLINAKGPSIQRSQTQLLEMLTWTLEYTGRTNAQMANQLAISESTSRSYLCRLRRWLGNDQEGNPYLPLAYSHRIWISPLVRWDIQEALQYLGRDPSARDDGSLLAALELIRGPVFSDIGRGKWRWADPLRVHVTTLLVDAAIETIKRAKARNDADLALWAALKGLMVCPWHKPMQLAFDRLRHQTGPEIRINIKEFIDKNWEIWNQTEDGW